MDEPEPLETARMNPPPLQLRDVDPCGIAGNHILHCSETIDKDADLDADLM
jgi:hypothetical protein